MVAGLDQLGDVVLVEDLERQSVVASHRLVAGRDAVQTGEPCVACGRADGGVVVTMGVSKALGGELVDVWRLAFGLP